MGRPIRIKSAMVLAIVAAVVWAAGFGYIFGRLPLGDAKAAKVSARSELSAAEQEVASLTATNQTLTNRHVAMTQQIVVLRAQRTNCRAAAKHLAAATLFGLKAATIVHSRFATPYIRTAEKELRAAKVKVNGCGLS